jgi:chemotaxis protein CheD
MMPVTQDGVTTLHPGDVVLGLRGDRLQTLLGSCVAVVLTDPRRTLGVMCHVVHARPATPPAQGSTAHADVALHTMADLIHAHGLVASMCEAYVYGGGNMFPHLVPGVSVGDHNVAWVLDALNAQGIRVLSVDTGGAVYRQLRWTVGPDVPHTVAVPL